MHRHHPSSELRNRQSVIYHKLGGDRELFLQREFSMPTAASKLAAVPSSPPASISKTPVAVRNATITTTSLPIESTEAPLTVLDYGGTKKIAAAAFLIDKCLQTTDFRSWTIRFKSEVCHSSQ